jgi:TusA-related sulfurtransferase
MAPKLRPREWQPSSMHGEAMKIATTVKAKNLRNGDVLLVLAEDGQTTMIPKVIHSIFEPSYGSSRYEVYFDDKYSSQSYAPNERVLVFRD